MPAFRQRPLTWLFLIALACLNVLAIATDFRLDWYADLIAAQVFIAGGWLALGHAHRLARAGLFTAVIVASATPDYLMGADALGTWRFVLGSIIVLGVATAVSCWCWLLVAHLTGRQPIASPRWQFSLAEVFGWMILVAVGATVVPAAAFRHLSYPDSNWQVLVGTSALAGLMMTLFLRRPSSDLASVAICMVAATVMAVLISRLDAPSDYMSLIKAYVVVGLWILVQRLDAQTGRSPPTSQTPPALS